MSERCAECGSWDRQCSAESPVAGCGCARCLRAELARERSEIERLTATLQTEVARMRTLLREAALSGVEFTDPRINYVTVQIDAETWATLEEFRK